MLVSKAVGRQCPDGFCSDPSAIYETLVWGSDGRSRTISIRSEIERDAEA